MKITTLDNLVDIMFELSWQDNIAAHTEYYYGSNVNLWRDCIPSSLYQNILDLKSGESITADFKAGEIIPDYKENQVYHIKASQFNGQLLSDTAKEPRLGRFYPKGILQDMPGIFKGNVTPFRCVDIQNSKVGVDFNHPLAGKSLRVSAEIRRINDKSVERGGTCMDWIDTISSGPGMQTRFNGTATEFFKDDPFKRGDEQVDTIFYNKPRLVTHIDDAAAATITDLYTRILKSGDTVLDLMAGWKSHLPDNMSFSRETGLGMNKEEIEANPQLTDYIIHDLNENPVLPFDDNLFDVVVCTVSVEYLIRPFDVFKDVARVVKPGGYFAVTFSDRWFPPKAINIWANIHDFERMGLVTEFFLDSGRFHNIRTFSIRGLPRPLDDKYINQRLFSDPVFCVWGQVDDN